MPLRGWVYRQRPFQIGAGKALGRRFAASADWSAIALKSWKHGRTNRLEHLPATGAAFNECHPRPAALPQIFFPRSTEESAPEKMANTPPGGGKST